MGQKVHPYGFRVGIIKDWNSKWFVTKKDYARFIYEDIKLREYIKKNLSAAKISKVEIERAGDKLQINLYTARPGVIIGRKGAEIDRVREELQEISNKDIHIAIKEIKKPGLEAQLIAENVAFQLEKRIAYRRVMKRTVQLAVDSGAQGIKISCKGRLAGSEIARRETYKEGKIPLHTLRADIDFGFTQARTTYGAIGIKVWVYKGDILPYRNTVDTGGRIDAPTNAQKG